MTGIPGGRDPLGPEQDPSLPYSEGDVPEGVREPHRRPLIPKKYQGFIPLVIILIVTAVLLIRPVLLSGGTGDTGPSQTVPIPATAIPIPLPGNVTTPPAAGTQVTVTPTVAGPPDFTLSTSPVSASARRGETVTYTMVIDGKNGFDSPVRLELTATALFVTRRYDFGTYNPPFPRTIHYPFVVPDYLPPGVTIDGVLKATSDDLVRENRLTLIVE